jgi:hypothetical protein
MKKPTSVIYGIALMLQLWLLMSCTDSIQNNNSYIQRLKNRGIVPLSTVNPYIAGNALINKEMDRSPELKGFIQHSGAPSAIRVEQGIFSPLYIELYYPAKSEYYSAEENNGIWLLNGPYHIDKDTLLEIKKISIITGGTGKIELPLPAATIVPELPTAIPSARPVPLTFATPSVTPLQANTAQPALSVVGGIESLASQFGRSQAEITPKGDVVHYVSNPGETVVMLARWYTFDAGNQQRIMRINHLENKQILSIGDSVVIPSYLVKNKNILTQEALSAMEQGVSIGSIK